MPTRNPERMETSSGLTGGSSPSWPINGAFEGTGPAMLQRGDRVVNHTPMNEQYNGNGLQGRAQIVQEYKFKQSADGEERRGQMSKYYTCVLILTIVLNN